MGLDQIEIVEPEPGVGQRPLPGECGPFEGDDVAPAHRQEVVDLLGRAKDHRFFEAQRRRRVGQHHRRGTVGDQRTVGALERTGDYWIFVRHSAAEFVAEILLHLGQRVGHTILVVLRGDPCERVGLVAVALKIALRDFAEDAGEATLDRVFFLAIAGAEQDVADLRSGDFGHLFDTHDERQPCAPRGDRIKPLMDRCRAGGTRVFDARCRLEAKTGIGLKDQGGGEFLADKAAVHRAEIDGVDIGGRDAGIGQGGLRHLDDQRLDVPALVLAKFAVRPTDDATTHAALRNAARGP